MDTNELPFPVTSDLVRMDHIRSENIEWLWYPYIPYGKVTLIHGNPGDGKTFLAIAIAAAVSSGKPLPGDINAKPGIVIYQTAEDGLGDTIKPRLDSLGANNKNIYIINEDNKDLTLTDERIGMALDETKAKLLIIDPIQAYLGSDVDMYRANEVRASLKPICKLAEEYKCAIVIVGHLNKSDGKSSINRGLGSMDFAAAVRSILILGRYKDDANIRVIVHNKSSLAPEGGSMAFRLDGKNGFEWVEGYENVTAEDVLAASRSPKSHKVTKIDKAVEFLSGIFRERREIPAYEIYERADKLGICKRTIDQAKSDFPGGRLKSVKVGARWVWTLEEELDLPYEITDDDHESSQSFYG